MKYFISYLSLLPLTNFWTECYDPATDSWSVVGDMPSSRWSFGNSFWKFPLNLSLHILFGILQCLTFVVQIMAERCCLDDQERLGQGQAGLEEQRQWQGQEQARLGDPFRKNPIMKNESEFLKMSLHSQKHLFALVAFICALHVFPLKPRSTVVCILHRCLWHHWIFTRLHGT